MTTVLLWKSCCIRICAQVVKSMFHLVGIARLKRNTSYLMLLADGPSVNISIMEFRAHPQKFTNSSQHQAKLNNAMALELWKGDVFPNIKADWLFTMKTSAGLNCWILIQAGIVSHGEMLCPSCRLDYRKAADWLVIPLILLAYSWAHITPCNWNSQPWPCCCDPSLWFPILFYILSFVSGGVVGLTLMHASLEEPQLFFYQSLIITQSPSFECTHWTLGCL